MKRGALSHSDLSPAAVFLNRVITDAQLKRSKFISYEDGRADAATSVISGWNKKEEYKSKRGEPLLAQAVFFWFFRFVAEPSYFLSIAEQTWSADDAVFRHLRRAKEGMTKDDPLEEVVRRFRSERENYRHESEAGKADVRSESYDSKLKMLESVEQKAHAKALYLEFLRASLTYPKLSMARYDREDIVEEDQYDTYVSLMLSAFDEYMAFDEEHCIEPLEYQIKVHGDYIRMNLHKDAEGAANVRSGYSALMLSHIDRIFDEVDRERLESKAV